MERSRYPVSSNDFLLYHFYSEGPRGRIKKAIIYKRIEENIFNLAFGDWIEALQLLDDSSRSNNGDRNKILATVAYTALDFTRRFPGTMIFVEGSTPSRTRLYQMGIVDNLLEINMIFEIQGFWEGEWQPFRRNTNYEAFLIWRK